MQPFSVSCCQAGNLTKNMNIKMCLATILVAACFASCKKGHLNNCKATMTDIAGAFKITKFETVSYSTGAAQDITSSLTSCQLSAIYQFNADSTATYNEPANCGGSSSGTWSVSGSGFYASFNSANANRIGLTSITSWNCVDLVLTTLFPSVNYNYRFTLTRVKR